MSAIPTCKAVAAVRWALLRPRRCAVKRTGRGGKSGFVVQEVRTVRRLLSRHSIFHRCFRCRSLQTPPARQRLRTRGRAKQPVFRHTRRRPHARSTSSCVRKKWEKVPDGRPIARRVPRWKHRGGQASEPRAIWSERWIALYFRLLEVRDLPRGGAVWQLVGLITRRSKVQILPPQPDTSRACSDAGPFYFSGCAVNVPSGWHWTVRKALRRSA